MKHMRPLDLAEEEIAAASVDELRDAYRELLAEARSLRARIGEGTRAAIDDLRAHGLKFNGNLPYGLESDDKTKQIRTSRYEQRLIAEVRRLHAAKQPLRAIARTLTERGYRNRAGHPIDAKQVSRILRGSAARE